MFKDKVKVTAIALVMVLLMILSVTTDLFIGLADVFRAKASEATPTDATPVTRDVSLMLIKPVVLVELHDMAVGMFITIIRMMIAFQIQ